MQYMEIVRSSLHERLHIRRVEAGVVPFGCGGHKDYGRAAPSGQGNEFIVDLTELPAAGK